MSNMENYKLFNLLASLNASRDIVITEIRKLGWEYLAKNGLEYDATFVYRAKHNSSLLEAREAVKKFIADQ